jgi:DNA-binding transcriptional LysR family regulator
MTLDQLRIFVAVAERLHVTQAAASLHITQSAASAAVQSLEASTGARLLNRVGRGIELTAAGNLLLTEARAVLARVHAAEQALDDLAGLRRGHLTLWASQTIASYVLPRLMHRFRTAYPGIAISLHIGNSTQVAEAVLEGAADMGFIEGDTDSPLLVRSDIGGDHMRLVLPVNAAKPGNSAAQLHSLTWVMREPGSGTRALHELALRALGVDPAAISLAMELPSNEAVLAAVLAGAGATILSGLLVDAPVAAGRLAVMNVKLPSRRFVALRHADRIKSAAATAFLGMAQSEKDAPETS